MAVTACSSEIATNLDERQSREVMAALGRAGVAAERVSGDRAGGTYAVEVPSKDAARAMAVLEAEGLPRPAPKGFATLYGSASMIPTATEEKARYLDALGSEIATHLGRLDGVLDASVIITSPTQDPLAPPEAEKPKATASVLLRLPADGQAPNEENVKALVAGAVENLAADDVKVATTRAPAAPATEGPAFAKVGPFTVARASKAVLTIVLAVALLLIIGLGLWAFIAVRRSADLRRRIEALERAGGHAEGPRLAA